MVRRVWGPRRVRTKNALMNGAGAETMQDRGSMAQIAQHTMHPYFDNNFLSRWQTYIRWYNTAWEARKIIDIPVADALREPVTLEGLSSPDIVSEIMGVYEESGAARQLRRALIQERLLGGSSIFAVLKRPKGEELSEPLKYSTIEKGDLLGINVIDISRLARPTYETNPFAAEYDRIDALHVNGTEVHSTRMCILDGDALFNRASQQLMENFRFNPCGFGESILAPVYDLMNRTVGTQQAAFHLVHLASCLVVGSEGLRYNNAFNGGDRAKAALETIIEQLSIYKGAVIEGKDVDIRQHSATFGSVPELVMSFLTILSAAADIPATRFLGQAPGGLNATGESDLENYYNSVESWLRSHVMAPQRRIFDWIGCSRFGAQRWMEWSKNLKLVYPELWNLDEVQKSAVDTAYVNAVITLYETDIITKQQAFDELKNREVFTTDIEFEQLLEDGASDGDEIDVLDIHTGVEEVVS